MENQSPNHELMKSVFEASVKIVTSTMTGYTTEHVTQQVIDIYKKFEKELFTSQP
jgi:putative N-acetylmannosamine-6-phosphate epimerase